MIWNGSVTWGGIDAAELDYNCTLAPGPDFGGNADYTEYLPAILRYDGRLFLALGDDGKKKLIRSNHHVLLISGLYGVVTPTESIQLYSCPIEGESVIQDLWTTQQLLTNILIDYIRKNKIIKIFDFTAREDYRKVINWDYIKSITNAEVLYCFTKMSAYDYALIEFGNVLRKSLLDYSEKDLHAITPDTVIGEVIFRGIPETWDNLPKEQDIFIIQNAVKEIPTLPSYSMKQIPNKLRLSQENIEMISFDDWERGWLVVFTSEFQKNIDQYNDKKLQGRMLEAIADIVGSPLTKRGDTVKPLTGVLKGKWRYRIGDFRIIYYPDEQAKKVSLLAFLPRGNAYLD